MAVCLVLTLLSGCSRDPNVRKQKYLESGQRYFDKGQYREAEIQFENAIQVDDRFRRSSLQAGTGGHEDGGLSNRCLSGTAKTTSNSSPINMRRSLIGEPANPCLDSGQATVSLSEAKAASRSVGGKTAQ